MNERSSLQALIERHCRTLHTNTELIGRFIASIDGPDGAAAVRDALDLAHQVAGAGGSIGFRSVSVAAHALEQELKVLVKTPSAGGRAAVRRLFSALRAVVAEVRPEASTLYGMEFTRSGAARQQRPS